MPHYTAPNIEERLNVFEEASLGGIATFRCGFQAHPKPSVCWFKDDLPIGDDDRVSIREEVANGNGTTLSLTIRGVTKNDEGAYRCSVENSEGVASTTGYLSVSDMSSSISDPDPVDQSLIDSLLLRVSSSQQQPTSTAPNNEADAFVIPPEASRDVQLDNYLDLPEIEFISLSSADDSEKANKSRDLGSRTKGKESEAKDSTADRIIVNVYTILNSETSFHDSFKPIEISKVEMGFNSNQLISADVSVNKLRTTTDGESAKIRNGNISGAGSAAMNLRDIHYSRPTTQKFETKQETARKTYDYDFKNGKNFLEDQDDEYETQSQFSSTAGDFFKLQYKTSTQGNYSVKSNEEEKIPRYTKMTNWETIAKDHGYRNRSGEAPELKSTKATKWLKAKSGLTSLNDDYERNNSDEKTETSSIIARRKTSKPGRKVCYNDDEPHRNDTGIPTSAITSSSPIPDQHPLQSSEGLRHPKPTASASRLSGTLKIIVNEATITWNEAFTNLFKFPKVLGVFFVLVATMVFLYFQFNPVLVTAMVSILWIVVIHLYPILNEYFGAENRTLEVVGYD